MSPGRASRTRQVRVASAASSMRVSAQTSRSGLRHRAARPRPGQLARGPPRPRRPSPHAACHSERPSVKRQAPALDGVGEDRGRDRRPRRPARASSQAARICAEVVAVDLEHAPAERLKAAARSTPAHGSRRLPRCSSSAPSGQPYCCMPFQSTIAVRLPSAVRGATVDGLPDLALLDLAVTEHDEGVDCRGRGGGRPWPCPRRARGPGRASRSTRRGRAAEHVGVALEPAAAAVERRSSSTGK